MHIYAPRLAVMDLTADHCWIGISLHLKASDAVPMDIAALKVTLEVGKKGSTVYMHKIRTGSLSCNKLNQLNSCVSNLQSLNYHQTTIDCISIVSWHRIDYKDI